MFNGLKIVVDKNCETRRWVYPVEQFWEYIPSPETEKWCRFFGFGHQVYEPGAFQIGDTLLVHPVIFEQLKKHTQPKE